MSFEYIQNEMVAHERTCSFALRSALGEMNVDLILAVLIESSIGINFGHDP
jgi:hypothetical protein